MKSPCLRIASASCLLVAVLSTNGISTFARQNPPTAGQTKPDPGRAERSRLFDAAKTAYAEGDYAKAEPLIVQGLKVAEREGALVSQADFLNLLGLVYYHRGNLQPALEYYRRALKLYQSFHVQDEKINQNFQVGAASILNNMGNASDRLGLIAESMDYKQQSLKIREQIGDKGKIADSLNGVGVAHEHMNQHATALDYYGRALKLYEMLKDGQGIAYVCANIGDVYVEQGDFEGALKILQRSLDAAKAVNDKSSVAVALNGMANAHQALGNLDKALEVLFESLKLKQTMGNPQEIANAFHNIGNVYADMGQFDRALVNLLKALELRKQVGNLEETAGTQMNIGTVYDSLGRLAEAQALYEQARTVIEKTGDQATLARCLVNLANIAAQQGRAENALKLAARALELRQKIASPQEIAESWVTLGSMHKLRGARDDFDKALECYNHALPVLAVARNTQALAMTLDAIGAVYQLKNEHARAIGYHLRGLELRRRAGNKQQIVTSLTNLAGAYQSLNRMAEAETCFEEAAKLFEQVGDQVGEPSQYGAYQQTTPSFYAYYANLKIAQKRPFDALLVVERGRAHGIALQARQNAAALETRLRPDDIAKKREMEEALSRATARLNLIVRSPAFGDPKQEKARQDRLSSTRRDRDAAELDCQLWRDAFFARNPDYRGVNGQAPPDAKTLKTLAERNSDTLYLEWQVKDDKGFLLFALTNTGIKAFHVPMLMSELDRQIHAWLTAIEAGRFAKGDGLKAEADEMRAGRSLYRLLFGEIEAAGLLGSTGLKRLVLVADTSLLHVPFAALVTADGRRLVDRFSLASAISLGSLTWPVERRTAIVSVLCIADPIGTGDPAVSRSGGMFSALAGARSEGVAIKALVPNTTLLIGPQAREDRIKREMPNYTVLHFATHGVLDTKNPMRSALILAPESPGSLEDGILDAREISGMHLAARLAVLSACNTTGGQVRGGDGLIGLTWALRAAGCPAIVATHWAINDAATTVLMRAYYGALATGKRKDEALRAAMLAVRSDKSRRSPYYWAAFQLIGDTSPLPLNWRHVSGRHQVSTSNTSN